MDNSSMDWNSFASDSTLDALYGNMCRTSDVWNYHLEYWLWYYCTWLLRSSRVCWIAISTCRSSIPTTSDFYGVIMSVRAWWDAAGYFIPFFSIWSFFIFWPWPVLSSSSTIHLPWPISLSYWLSFSIQLVVCWLWLPEGDFTIYWSLQSDNQWVIDT